MTDGRALLAGQVPYFVTIEGSINGKNFHVEGNGVGHASVGFHSAKYVCTTGKLPMSWYALSPTLGYGVKIYVKCPDHIPNWWQDCMPEGYAMERKMNFDGDGTCNIRHEITYKDGAIRAYVKFEGVDFKPDSPVLNDGIADFYPSYETNFPYKDGIKTHSSPTYPLKNKGEHLQCFQDTYYYPLGNNKRVTVPDFHFQRLETKLSKHPQEQRDHMIHEEYLEALRFKFFHANEAL